MEREKERKMTEGCDRNANSIKVNNGSVLAECEREKNKNNNNYILSFKFFADAGDCFTKLYYGWPGDASPGRDHNEIIMMGIIIMGRILIS